MKLLVRSGIVLFGSVALLLVGAIVFVGDPDTSQDLRDLAAAFEAEPEEAKLREFLNTPADASYGLEQLALAGRLLHDHEDVFRALASKPVSENEGRILRGIAMLGTAVFEHYPELEPPGFATKVAGMKWIESL